jgi:hypothetical protein
VVSQFGGSGWATILLVVSWVERENLGRLFY